MNDPYSVLGISRGATDDEIKKAYRALSRKYHPDANINNPNKDQAEAKFKEVQQAYQQIMHEREYGTTVSISRDDPARPVTKVTFICKPLPISLIMAAIRKQSMF